LNQNKIPNPQQLKEIVENLDQGIALFNSDFQLSYWNNQYIEIFCFPSDFIHSGIHITKILSWLAEHGTYGEGDVDELTNIKFNELTQKSLDLTPIRVHDNTVHIRKQITPSGDHLFSYICITSQIEFHEKYAGSEKQFRTMSEVSSNMMVLARASDGEIMYCNSAAEQILGLPPEKVVGTFAADYYVSEFSRDKIVTLIKKDTTLKNHETKFRKPNGSTLWVSINSRLTEINGEPYLFSEIVDISNRKEAESALAISEQRFRDFTDTASDWAWETDTEHRVSYVAGNLFFKNGFSEDFFMGKTRQEYLGENSIALAQELWIQHQEDLDHHRSFKNFEYPIYSQNNELRYFRLSGKPLFDSNNTFMGYRGTGSDVTTRVQSKRDLRSSQQMMSSLLKNTQEGFWHIDNEGLTIDANPAMCTMLKRSQAEIIGKTIFDFVDHKNEQIFLQELEKRKTGAIGAYEIALSQPDGAEINCINNATAIFDEHGVKTGSIGLWTDISKLKVAENELQEAYEHIQSILNASPSGFAITRPNDGYIEYANSRLAHMAGSPLDQIIGSLATSFYVNTDDRPPLVELLQQSEPVTDREVQFRRADGSIFWGLLTLKPTIYKGKKCISAWIHEITQLKEALDYAKSASSAKSEFLSSMSHELRTPMNAILGFTQLLDLNSENSLSEDQRESVSEILKAGKHLLELINQVLDLATVESGKLSVSIENLVLHDICQDSLSIIQASAIKRGLNIRTDFTSTQNIRADRTRLKQVLLNLLSNAVNYNHKGGAITLASKDIENHWVRISVIDTGIGIAAEYLSSIFKPFNRIDANLSEISGAGIGLSIIKQLVEAMGGRSGVESTLENGSTFWVDFPASEETSTGQKEATEPSTNDLHREKAAATVLYIEDNPANLQLMKVILSRVKGVAMVSAHNAEIGLTMATEQRPELILMDINLPGMNGIAAKKELCTIPETKNIPVIAISAAAMKHDIDMAMAAGFKAYLTKPFNIPELVETIKKELRMLEP